MMPLPANNDRYFRVRRVSIKIPECFDELLIFFIENSRILAFGNTYDIFVRNANIRMEEKIDISQTNHLGKQSPS